MEAPQSVERALLLLEEGLRPVEWALFMLLGTLQAVVSALLLLERGPSQ